MDHGTESQNNKPKKSVILVHGIGTRAEWYIEVKKVLENNGFEVFLTNYDWFSVIKFLLPIAYFRNIAAEELFKQIRIAKHSARNSEFSVIAHSFGTYLISKILYEEFDLSIDRIIFAGSVVKSSIPLEKYTHRFTPKLLNEVCTKDIWPVLAENITTGYGHVGTFGFKRPLVEDRYFPGGHSAVLNAAHCQDYWVPFLNDGTIKQSDHTEIKPPIWIRAFNFIKIKYLLSFAALIVIAFILARSIIGADSQTVSFAAGDGNWTLGDNNYARTINQQINETCPLKSVFGKMCDSALARLITKRTWKPIGYFDSKLKEIQFIGSFYHSFTDPITVYRAIDRAYPNCLNIIETPNHYELKPAKDISIENGRPTCNKENIDE